VDGDSQQMVNRRQRDNKGEQQGEQQGGEQGEVRQAFRCKGNGRVCPGKAGLPRLGRLGCLHARPSSGGTESVMFDRSSIGGTREGAAAADPAPGRRRAMGAGGASRSPLIGDDRAAVPSPDPVPVVLRGRRTVGRPGREDEDGRRGLGPGLGSRGGRRETAASPSPGPGGSEETDATEATEARDGGRGARPGERRVTESLSRAAAPSPGAREDDGRLEEPEVTTWGASRSGGTGDSPEARRVGVRRTGPFPSDSRRDPAVLAPHEEGTAHARLESSSSQGRVVGAERRLAANRARRGGIRTHLRLRGRREDFSELLGHGQASGCCGQRVMRQSTDRSGDQGLVHGQEKPACKKLCIGARSRRSRKATGAEGGDCIIFALRGLTLAGRADVAGLGGGEERQHTRSCYIGYCGQRPVPGRGSTACSRTFTTASRRAWRGKRWSSMSTCKSSVRCLLLLIDILRAV
ncbi:hypothetical protein THAOC_29050, partial [Thalassiosira oceanica]